MEDGKLVALNEGLTFPTPTFHRVIIEPMEEVVSSILHIPEGAKGKPTQGRIRAVGPGRWSDAGTRVPCEFKAGQIVVFRQFAGEELKFDGKTYLLVPEDEVIAVLG
ncbi:MAG: co-chaperone GroES [Nitrospirales bacterium]|jgi:chaperonin GroES